MKKCFFTEKGPKAIGPYCTATVNGSVAFLSGMLGIDPATGKLAEGGIEAQAKQAIENLRAVLEAAGSGLDKVVKTTCFISSMGDFAAFNEVYGQYFTEKPARSCVAVKELPKGALVEVEVIAEKC